MAFVRQSFAERNATLARGLFLSLGMLIASIASARTITLTAEDCDQMAFINEAAPDQSWAGIQPAKGVFGVTNQVQLRKGVAVLIRFPLDQIPKDQRILKAELTLHAQYVEGKSRVQIRKLLADWGTGVSHRHRRTVPEKLAWSQPGAMGSGTDRANKDSGVFNFPAVGNATQDLTEDIELWYTGAVANRGWMLTPEEGSGAVYLASPYSPHSPTAKQWKLQITFESQ